MKERQRVASAATTAALSLLALAVLGMTARTAQAQIMINNTFTGQVGLTTDGLGTTNGTGTLQAEVPLGSTIVGAYLYALTPGGGFGTAFSVSPTITFAGTAFSNATLLAGGYTAYFDVTSAAQAAYNAATVTQNFTMVENNNLEGSALAVVYSNAALGNSTVVLAGGLLTGSNVTYDLTLPEAISSTTSIPLSIGIGYGVEDSADQQSALRINGTLLSSAVGGNDDGVLTNGALVTVGGVGDSTANPANPNATTASRANDDELYNIGSFTTVGATSISIGFSNTSANDYLFFNGLQYSSAGSAAAPEPTSIALLGIGATGLVSVRRRRNKQA